MLRKSNQLTNKSHLRFKDRKKVNKEEHLQQTKATGQQWSTKEISQRSAITLRGMILTFKYIETINRE